MPPPERTLDIRPRTTGQILDDAWRLALADAPLLLTLSSLFSVPVFVEPALFTDQACAGVLDSAVPLAGDCRPGRASHGPGLGGMPGTVAPPR